MELAVTNFLQDAASLNLARESVEQRIARFSLFLACLNSHGGKYTEKNNKCKKGQRIEGLAAASERLNARPLYSSTFTLINNFFFISSTDSFGGLFTAD